MIQSKTSLWNWGERENDLGHAGVNAMNTCLSSNLTDIDWTLFFFNKYSLMWAMTENLTWCWEFKDPYL